MSQIATPGGRDRAARQATAGASARADPATSTAPGPQGGDVASLDMQQYAQLRGQLGMGRSQQEGKGIFD